MISLEGFLRLGRITPVSPMLHPTEITPAFTTTATNTYQNHSKQSTVCQSINMIFEILLIFTRPTHEIPPEQEAEK